jgi:putative ABC transport system permease protein
MTPWTMALRLARRELRTRFRGLRLLLVCLFLGVGALAAIGSLASAVERELSSRGQIILGGDLQLGIGQRRAEPDERAAIAAMGPVSETIRLRSMAVRGTQSVPISLKAIDSAYPLYGRLTLADGRSVRTPARSEAWVAPGLAERMDVKPGDKIRLGRADFRIAGIIAEEPDRLSEGFAIGPVVIISFDGLERSQLIQPGSLYETRYRVQQASGDPAAQADSFKARFAERGWESRTRDQAAPGTSRFVDRMGDFLGLVGLAALAIAGIGIAGGVTSYLAARRSSIATLKVLGADSAIIVRAYLLQVLAVSVVGIAFGLLAGIGATPLLVALAGDLLPVAPGFAVHPAPLALAAVFGLLIALAAAAVPLAQGTMVPAAALLRGVTGIAGRTARHGWLWVLIAAAGIIGLALATAAQPRIALMLIGSVLASLLVLAGLGRAIRVVAARAPRPRTPLARLALASLHRPGAQTESLVVALGLGLTLFVMLAAVRSSLEANIQQTVPQQVPALFALDVPRDRVDQFRAVVESAAGKAEIATVPLLRGTVTAYGSTRVIDLAALPQGAYILRGERGITYAGTLPPGSILTEGTWWGEKYAGPPLVSVEAEQARALGLKLGDPLSISVLGQEITARVASFRQVQWDTMGFNFVLLFSPGTFDDFPHNLSATINMDPARAPTVTRALLQSFPSVSVVEVGAMLGQAKAVVGQLSVAIAAVAAIAVLAGLAVLIGAIIAAREARTYDAVMLKVLGATRGQVLLVQALEYLALGIAVAVVALALGLGAGWAVIVALFDFAWLPDMTLVLTTLATGIIATLVIGLIGTLPILSARPAQALRTL